MFAPETKFIVVDDFATMRKIIKKVLGELGFKNIEEAEDGKPALEMVKAAAQNGQPFDFIISDWNMPGMQGIEFLKAVRGDASLKHLPFLMVTAEADQKNIIEAAQAGVTDYIVKPFNALTLKSKLEKVYLKVSKKAA